MLQERFHQIWIGMGSAEGFWQKIEYENLPPYCTHCWHVGHTESKCHVHNPALKAKSDAQITSTVRQEYRPKPTPSGPESVPEIPIPEPPRVDHGILALNHPISMAQVATVDHSSAPLPPVVPQGDQHEASTSLPRVASTAGLWIVCSNLRPTMLMYQPLQ